jgi:hypothetical protein
MATHSSDSPALYSPRMQVLNQAAALGLIALFAVAVSNNIGAPLAVIVAGSALIGFFGWRITNLRRPIHPQRTAILFLLTTAALHVHMFEEHASLFGPAMSRLFGMAFPDDRFLLVFVFILPTLYYLTAIGLLLRIPLAGFIAWFIFIGPGIAEFTHFLFPLLRPALEPANAAPIDAVVRGVYIAGMENHYTGVAAGYYFPGLYTALLPMLPGGYTVYWLLKQRRHAGENPSF